MWQLLTYILSWDYLQIVIHSWLNYMAIIVITKVSTTYY